MKIDISTEQYISLIQEIFEEIYIEVRKSTKFQKEFYYCELGGKELHFYPNFDFDDNKIICPNFDRFEYQTQTEDLKNLLFSDLKNKYEEYIGSETIYQTVKLHDTFRHDGKSLNYNIPLNDYTEEYLETVFEKAVFNQVFYYLEMPCHYGNNIIEDGKDYIRKLKSNDYNFSADSIIKKDDGEIVLKASKDFSFSSYNNNILIIDISLFLHLNEEKVNKCINNSKFKSLLKLECDVRETPNPFIDLFYNTIVNQFILFETEFQNMIFQDNSSYVKCDLNPFNEEHLVALSYEIMSLLESKEEVDCPSPFKFILTNQRISKLIYKAIVLVINQRISEENRYTKKFNGLFGLDTNPMEGYTKRINRIYKKAHNPAFFRSELSAKNIVTLIYLLKEYKVINYKMNDTEIRTLMQLLTSYSEKTLNQLNKDLNSNIDKSSMDGGYLKSKGADRYKSELVKLLEKMMRDLKK